MTATTERMKTMMSHYLMEGFDGTMNNRFTQRPNRGSTLDVEKKGEGWDVTAHHSLNFKETVHVTVEDMMFWLYQRSFK